MNDSVIEIDDDSKKSAPNKKNLVILIVLLILSLLFTMNVKNLLGNNLDKNSHAALESGNIQNTVLVSPTPTLTIRTFNFYHHSTGGYVWYNDLRTLPLRVHDLAPEIPELTYNQNTDAPLVYDNNSPQQYFTYWHDATTSDHGSTVFHEQMDRYSNGQPNALMYEHCYTVDQIIGPSYIGQNIPLGGDPEWHQPPPGQPDTTVDNLMNYAAAYRGLRDIYNHHPEKAFLIWAPSAVSQTDTYGANQTNADNVRRFSNWLKDRGPNGFLGEDPVQVGVHNIYVFDWFDFTAKTDNPYDAVCDADGCSNRLRPDYCPQIDPVTHMCTYDSHPNPTAQQQGAIAISQWIVNSLRDYDNFHYGTGGTPTPTPTRPAPPTPTPVNCNNPRADVDHSHVVDISDFNAVKQLVGKACTNCAEDVVVNGVVDIRDINAVRNNFNCQY